MGQNRGGLSGGWTNTKPNRRGIEVMWGRNERPAVDIR